MQVTFELDQNFVVTDRQVYSVLDWLGDIGGLVESLFFIGGIVLMVFNYTYFDYLINSHLFKVRSKDGGNKKKPLSNSDQKELNKIGTVL